MDSEPVFGHNDEMEIRPPFHHDEGACWRTDAGVFGVGDDVSDPCRSQMVLLEDGVCLGPAHCPHGDIRQLGNGRYSHWSGAIYFSSSDNSNPNTNGRRYTAKLSADHYFAERASYAISSVSRWINQIPGGLNAIRGASVLEIGPGKDMGTALILAALGAKVAAVEKYPAVWDQNWHAPYIAAIMAGLKKENIPFDLEVFGRSAGAGAFYPDRVAVYPVNLEDIPLELSDWADITVSNAALEHLLDPESAFENLYSASKKGSIGLHQIDFRDHRDPAHPLEFLLLDDEEFERVTGEYRYRHGNRRRFHVYDALFRECGYDIVEFTPNITVGKEYFGDFLPRLRASSSKFRDADEADLMILAGHFRLTRR